MATATFVPGDFVRLNNGSEVRLLVLSATGGIVSVVAAKKDGTRDRRQRSFSGNADQFSPWGEAKSE